jgi:hypothetical protein
MGIKALRLLLLALIISFSGNAFAQHEDEVDDSKIIDNLTNKKGNPRQKKEFNLDNFFVGSGVSMQFWGNQFGMDLLPYFGYRIGDRIAPGVGMSYMYSYNMNTETSLHIYGPKVLLKLRPFKNARSLQGFYLYGEYEYLIIEKENQFYNPNNPGGVPRFNRLEQARTNVGFGSTSNFEKGFGVTYEFLYDVRSINNPTIFFPISYRIGFYYGF